MKQVDVRPPQGMWILYRVLVGILIIVVAILLGGTVYGLIRKGTRPAEEALAVSASETGTEESGIFSGLGTMRIATADPEPETLIISLAFPYDKTDRSFSEELASRISAFKSVTEEYLGAFTAAELAVLDEAALNAELLSRYNAILRLGQIKKLFILEYMQL
ncbi:MAG: flagellar basal body protein FliL [Spirochaetaceae bacterium]|jgi:flagellar basal body-associated protein FliL|nr:flagellar basal body protein FliL [Spirochaetaceae bacterium]